jgi:hypothetical protein
MKKISRKFNRNLLTGALLGAGFLLMFMLSAQTAAAQFVPGGSYQKSCQNTKLDGGTLKAQCRPKDSEAWAQWRDTSLERIYECDGDIWNNNAVLNCNRNRNSPLNKQAQAAFTAASMEVFGQPLQGDPTGIEMYAWIFRMFRDYGMAKNFYAGTKQADAEKVLIKSIAEDKSAPIRKSIIDRAFYQATGGEANPTEFASWDAKIQQEQAWYKSIFTTARLQMNLNPPKRKLMIQVAYVTVFGRMPTDGDLSYWQSRTEGFKEMVEANRAWLYSPNGAKDLADAVTSVLKFNLNKTPSTDQINTAMSEYRKKRLVFTEMRGAMPAIYY